MSGMYTLVGEIEAKVWYSKREKIKLNTVALRKTGNEEKIYKIFFNNFEINLLKTLPKFEKYDTIYEERKVKIFSDFYLPITLGISTYYELYEQEINLNVTEAKNMLIEKLKNELSDEVENIENVENIKVNSYEEEGSIEVEVIYEVIEKIGTEEKIIY